MAKLIQQFNARNFNPEQGVGGFPIGNHLVKNISSEVKATKAGDGGYLMYTAQIIDGEHAGTTGAIRLNLYSSSPDAARIAHQQFSAMCHVTNVMDVQDSSQLHEIPFRIEVGLQKEPNPQKYTEVKKFFDVNGHAPGANGQPATDNSGFSGQQQQGGQQQGGNAGNSGNGGNGGQWGNSGGQQQQDNGGNNGGMGNQGGGNAGNGQQGGNGGQWGNGNQNGGQGGGNMGNGAGNNGGGQAWGNGATGGNGGANGNGGGSWGNAANNGAGNNGGNQWGSRQ